MCLTCTCYLYWLTSTHNHFSLSLDQFCCIPIVTCDYNICPQEAVQSSKEDTVLDFICFKSVWNFSLIIHEKKIVKLHWLVVLLCSLRVILGGKYANKSTSHVRIRLLPSNTVETKNIKQGYLDQSPQAWTLLTHVKFYISTVFFKFDIPILKCDYYLSVGSSREPGRRYSPGFGEPWQTSHLVWRH